MCRWTEPFSVAVAILLLNLLRVAPLWGVVLNFDDLASGTVVTGTSYGGLTWEMGNPGLNGHEGEWVTPSLAGSNHPHSAPNNLINSYGSTLIGVRFPIAVNISGAYIAVQGAGVATAYEVRVHGYLNGTEIAITPLLTNISSTPAWLDMNSLSSVDRIVFNASPAFEGQAYYGLDDLTFTYIPEPASLAMITLAGAGLLARRRRHK